jgi:hypothetical protein
MDIWYAQIIEILIRNYSEREKERNTKGLILNFKYYSSISYDHINICHLLTIM